MSAPNSDGLPGKHAQRAGKREKRKGNRSIKPMQGHSGGEDEKEFPERNEGAHSPACTRSRKEREAMVSMKSEIAFRTE